MTMIAEGSKDLHKASEESEAIGEDRVVQQRGQAAFLSSFGHRSAY